MSDVEEIKSRIDIVDVVGKIVKLKKTGRNFKGLCPFHSEKTPSFIVSPDRQTCHCFGCGKGGDIFSFFMEYHHVDFGEALADLADLAGVTLTRRTLDPSQTDVKQKIFEVNHLASEFYQYLLTKHTLGERGLLYLKNRGISEKSMKTFALGYSPNSWEGLYKYLRKKGYEDEIMEKAGLVIRSARGCYDRFRGRVMFTLKDHRGNVVGFAGRVLDQAVKEAKYINTAETPVYSKSNVLYGLDVTRDAIQKANEALIMEGELDVISSFQAGISNAVAIKGTALTEGHVRLLKRFTERIVFALDSDMAGDAAARRGIEIADREGLDIRVVRMPSGKDPDEASREHAGLFKKAIQEAIPVYDYFLSSALARFDVNTAFGKKKISDEVGPAIAKIENPIVRNHYVKKLADAIHSSEEAVEQRIRQSRIDPGRTQKMPEVSPVSTNTRPEKLEMYILALLLQGKTSDFFENLQESGLLPEFSHPPVHKIMEKLLSYFYEESSRQRIFLIKDFADSLPAELIPTFDEACLWDMGDITDDDSRLFEEWHRAMNSFERLVLRRKLYELTQRAGAEHVPPDVSKDIQREIQQFSEKLKHLEKSS